MMIPMIEDECELIRDKSHAVQQWLKDAWLCSHACKQIQKDAWINIPQNSCVVRHKVMSCEVVSRFSLSSPTRPLNMKVGCSENTVDSIYSQKDVQMVLSREVFVRGMEQRGSCDVEKDALSYNSFKRWTLMEARTKDLRKSCRSSR